MRHVWLVLVFFLAAADGRAAARLTIDEAVAEALANSPLIHRQEAHRRAAAFDEKAALADYFPRFSAGYGYQNLAESPFVNINGNTVIVNSRDQHHWELTVRQALFSGFAIRARHRLAALGLASREIELQQTVHAVRLRVRQHCFDLLIAEKGLAVAESTTAALAAHEADVETFQQNGLVPMNDLLKARVARADAVQHQHRAEATREQVRAALCLLLGREYDDALSIADPEPAGHPVPDLPSLIDAALTDRPEIAFLDRAILSRESEQRIASSDHYPHIELTGSYQRDGDDWGAATNDFTNPYNASLGIQARWTFFAFGKSRAQAAGVKARQRALVQEREQMRDEIRLQVVEAHLDQAVAARNIDTATTALAEAREHWRITRLLYQQQLATTTEVLDARSYLDRAESAYHAARYGYGKALARLDWAVAKNAPEM